MTRKQRRLILIGSSLGVLAVAVAIPVDYRGIVPDLFREGQGVVAEGHVEPDGLFKADTLLAKHDEHYMPREVVETLKKQGHWQETAAPNIVAAKQGAK